MAILLLAIGFSGCVETPDVISILEINNNPNKYINKNVKVQAYYEIGFVDETGKQWHTLKKDVYGFEGILKALLNESVDESILVQNGEYKFYGIIIQEGKSIYMLVNKIELV